MRNVFSGMVLWLLAATIAIGESDAAKTIQGVLAEKNAAYSAAYADVIAKQIEAAKQAESKLKALVAEQANTPGEADAIKARNDAVKERERLEALKPAAKDFGSNLGDLQRVMEDLRATVERQNKAEAKQRDDEVLLRAQVSKAETRVREMQAEVDRLGAQLKKKPVPPALALRFANLGKRWNWVDLMDCKHDNTKTWYEAKAFLKPGPNNSWLHYGMTVADPIPQWQAHYELVGVSPYGDSLVEVKVTLDENKSSGLALWNTVTDVIFPLDDIPYCASIDPEFQMHEPVRLQGRK
jgi:hypothetical protein